MSSYRWEESTVIHVEYTAGSRLETAIDDARNLSREKALPVRFTFNDMTITVLAKKD